MTVSLATETSMTIATLTPGSAYGTLGDARFFASQFTDQILTVDANVVKLICGNPSHGRRSLYLTSTAGFVSGAEVASHIGPIEGVTFAITGGPYNGQTLTAGEIPLEKGGKAIIDQENQNPQALLNYRPRYTIEGNKLYHNAAGMLLAAGTSAISVTVTYATYTRTTACQAPDEYFDAVFAGTIALMADVEGEHKAFQEFPQMYQLMQLAITTGQPSIPSLRLIQQIKAATGVPETQ